MKLMDHRKRILILVCTLFACIIGVSGMHMPSESVNASQIKWGDYIKREPAWYGSSEGIKFADMLISKQKPDGGWQKDMDMKTNGWWKGSTIDNSATTSQIIVLAKTYKATGNDKYLKSCLRGIDLLLDGQYENGGWPQVFGADGSYHAHITYNDKAMVRVMDLLRKVSRKEGDFAFVDDSYASRASAAVDKGVQCMLNTQIISGGVRTGWCQQYDENTLQPASARAYEIESISSAETAEIVQFLNKLDNKSPEVVNAIESAVKWMDDVKITGYTWDKKSGDKGLQPGTADDVLWARFYEIGTNKPMFVDRDGSKHYDIQGISKERSTGYAWYGKWGCKLIETGFVKK